MPKRVQMTRQKGGWRAENPDAVIVARYAHSKWGNPFAIGKTVYGVAGYPLRAHHIKTRADAVEAFARMLEREERNYPSLAEIRAELRGRDLACWCPLDQPCHADVLLDLANAEGMT